MLWLSAALGVVYLLAAATAERRGDAVCMGDGPARHEGWPEIGKTGARLERAWRNFLETFPIFAAAILVGAIAVALPAAR